MSNPGLIHFTPIYKSKVWGGAQLAELFGRNLPSTDIGESWELSDRGADTNTVAQPYSLSGKRFRNLIAENPEYILGARTLKRWGPDKFPLLVKFIDARDDLSVQVHPDDAYAQKHENEYGKAECWAILHVQPGARIQRGLKPGTTRQQFADALAAGTVEQLLHYFSPKLGDVLALPTGCVHAIGAGVVLAEIQQNSDVTYRVFDYNRPGLDGKPRALHIDKALAVTGFEKYGAEFGDEARLHTDTVTPLPVRTVGGLREELLADGERFTLSRLTLDPGARHEIRVKNGVLGANRTADACEVWMVLGGYGVAGVGGSILEAPAPFQVSGGQTLLVPGGEQTAWIEASKPITLLRAIPAS